MTLPKNDTPIELKSNGWWLVPLGLVLLLAVIWLSRVFVSDVGDALTRNTVRLSLAWYAVAACLMMQLGPGDWNATTRAGTLARWCWTWAVVCFLVHLAMAFHYYHHWSHAHAFERTRQVSGIGEGIYVSYLFTALWIVDVCWWWLRPTRYARRSAWIDRALHAFMLVIVLNGMVVFETGVIRWVGLAMFGFFATIWLAWRAPGAIGSTAA